ncbi:MAG: ribosomal protein S18-alanine N-acetyltransferase [Ardenticatenaceae bacterium]|nr:ribosomal protein S18-alanine N-acetyltransferase [Ardenticatenaceae bacterium]
MVDFLCPPFPYQLRPLQPADIDAVLAIEDQSFPSAARASFYRHELSENPLAFYQALVTGDSLLGYAGYWMMADEAHISILAVDPVWRGKRLGELLLLNLLWLACGQQALLATLEVRRSNVVAQKLYEKYQFEYVGERRRYYRDTGEDALLMTVMLNEGQYCQQLEPRRIDLFSHLSSAR